MESVKKWMDMLGLKVKDVVTGLEGIVTSTSFDLYGCVQLAVNPGLDKDGKPGDGRWFDAGRLKILSSKPVMEQPVFDLSVAQAKVKTAKGKKGPAEKSMPDNF
jgi:hypothetical protein